MSQCGLFTQIKNLKFICLLIMSETLGKYLVRNIVAQNNFSPLFLYLIETDIKWHDSENSEIVQRISNCSCKFSINHLLTYLLLIQILFRVKFFLFLKLLHSSTPFVPKK